MDKISGVQKMIRANTTLSLTSLMGIEVSVF